MNSSKRLSESSLSSIYRQRISIKQGKHMALSKDTKFKSTNSSTFYQSSPMNHYYLQNTQSILGSIENRLKYHQTRNNFIQKDQQLMSSRLYKQDARIERFNTINDQKIRNVSMKPAFEEQQPINEFKSVENRGDITFDQLKFESVIGKGSYATVKLYRDIQTEQKYAVKVYEKSKLIDPQRMNNVKREIEILKKIRHPNIIELKGVIEDGERINVIMEYISSVSLQQYLRSRQSLTESEGKRIFKQLVGAVKYLHERSICHRDIKLDNILMMGNSQIKLIDFGFAIELPMDRRSNIFCGTPTYMSPEMVMKIGHHPSSSDVWACGVVLYTLLCGELPFRGVSEKELFKKITSESWKLPGHLKLDSETLRSLKGCLEKNMERRQMSNEN